MFIIILWCNYTKKFFIFRYLLNFTTECIAGQIEGFSFLFCTLVMQKVQKVESINTAWMWNNLQKESRLIQCVYTQWKSSKRKRVLIHRMITKQRVKNEQIKIKQTCSVSFVKVCQFQDNKFKIVQKNFLEIIIKKIHWKTHQSWWSLHDKYGWSKAKDWW